MYARIESDKIKIYDNIPSKPKNTIGNYAGGFHRLPSEIHEYEGFKSLVKPEILDYSKQEYGKIIEYPDKFEYSIVDIIQSKIDEQAISDNKAERNRLLIAGVIVDELWFNEEYLGNFVNAVNLTEKNSLDKIEWKNNNDEWVLLTIAQANSIALKAMLAIQQIYKEN